MAERPVALVTGAARRIGAAIAADLARHGFAVAVHGRDGDDADRAAAGLVAAGGIAAGFAADLADMAETERLVDRVAAALGPVTLLVNNASVFVDDRADAFDWPTWDSHFALHLKAPAMLARRMAAGLPEGSQGLVVNIVDQRVERLNPRFFSYTLSKSALWTATRTMAQAYAPRLRVNAIGPGPTLQNSRQSAEDFARQGAGLLLGRGPSLDEFGATIRWMLATPSLTGQLVQLDGGQHLAWETPDVAGITE